MVKLNVLLTLFSFSSLIVLGKANECDDLEKYFENIEDFSINCIPNDNGQVTSVEFKGDTVTQEAINKVISYSTLTDLSFTKISSFPENLNFETISLEYINFNDLNGYKNRKFNEHDTPKNILKTLKKVENISISGYIISQTTLNDLSSLTKVKSIDFNRCRFNEGLNFSKFKNNKNLTTLSFSRFREERGLVDIPESLCQLKQLKTLHLSDNQLTTIPKCIKNLSNLEELDLLYNSIKSLPNELSKLTKLKSLDLQQNEIATIPSVIGKLTNLEKLNLDINKIKKFSTTLCQLKNLKYLSLNQNEISSIPSCIKNLNKVEEMSFDDNKISKLPDGFFDLDNLRRLDFYGNEFTKFPSNAKNNKKLVYLYMHFNKITSIPDSIKNLKKLQVLNLNNNVITNLPAALGELKDLTTLDLGSNKIDAEIPESLNNLKNLEYLVLGYNVDIRGKTLINKNLLVCTYNYQNNASNNLCAPESLKCIDENIPKC